MIKNVFCHLNRLILFQIMHVFYARGDQGRTASEWLNGKDGGHVWAVLGAERKVEALAALGRVAVLTGQRATPWLIESHLQQVKIGVLLGKTSLTSFCYSWTRWRRSEAVCWLC